MSAGAAGVQAWLTAHKTAVLAAGGVGAVAFAMRQKKKTATGQNVAGVTYGGNPQQMTGAGAYDSTAYDVYDSLEPQLESLQQEIDRLGTHTTTAPHTPASTWKGGAVRPQPGPSSTRPILIAQHRPPAPAPRRPPAPAKPTSTFAAHRIVAPPVNARRRVSLPLPKPIARRITPVHATTPVRRPAPVYHAPTSGGRPGGPGTNTPKPW